MHALDTMAWASSDGARATSAFMLNILFIAVFSETAGSVQTKHFVRKQKVNECYQKKAVDQTWLYNMQQYAAPQW